MNTIEVKGSKNIASIAYDPEKQHAEVYFKRKDGSASGYFTDGMTQEDFSAFEKAAADKDTSTGSYYHQNLKKKYDWKPL